MDRGVNQQSETWYCNFAEAPKRSEIRVGKRILCGTLNIMRVQIPSVPQNKIYAECAGRLGVGPQNLLDWFDSSTRLKIWRVKLDGDSVRLLSGSFG